MTTLTALITENLFSLILLILGGLMVLSVIVLGIAFCIVRSYRNHKIKEKEDEESKEDTKE